MCCLMRMCDYCTYYVIIVGSYQETFAVTEKETGTFTETVGGTEGRNN